MDYGEALVRELQPEEAYEVAAPVWTQESAWRHCRKTSWDGRFDGGARFSAAVEWRELGLLLYSIAEEGTSDVYGWSPTFRGRNATCNYRCAAAKNLDSAKRLKGPLLDFVRFLILEHESIKDEVFDVLGHPAFSDLDPSPVKMADAIPV